MRSLIKMLAFPAALIALIIIVSGPGYGQPAVGRQAPVFALDDVGGKSHDLATMENHPMIILYFFDVASPDPVKKACWRWMILPGDMRRPI